MDDTLNALLAALEGLDAPSASDRADVLGVLAAALPELDDLSRGDWDEKLEQVEDDVEQLGAAAEKAAARFDQGRRALETLTRFAERRGRIAAEQTTTLAMSGDDFEALNSDVRFAKLVGQAETTRDAIVAAMARRPQRAWTAVTITDALASYGRLVTRSNVQVSLRRLAVDGLVSKAGRGSYQIVSDILTGPPGQQIPDRQAEINRKAAVRREAAFKAAKTKKRKQEEQASQ